MSMNLFRFATAADAAAACGDRILELLAAARAERGRATIAVSGGSTPKLMFEAMATRGFDWRGVELFFVDERVVPPTDSQSNYRMTREALLDVIEFPVARVHRVEGELSPEDAAAKYLAEIRRVFGLRDGEFPVFDVIHRGMGPDMHTASLFPGEPLILNQTDLVASLWAAKMNQHRVTLLPGVLERARQTLYLVSGDDKAAGLRSVLREPPNPLQRPAQIGADAIDWYVDDAAYDGGMEATS